MLSGRSDDCRVRVESLGLLSELSLVVLEGLLPTGHVSWESGGVLSSGLGDLISELGNQSDDLLDGGAIAGLGQHGEGVDEREIGGVLAEGLELFSDFF